jgi:hypothetical protein
VLTGSPDARIRNLGGAGLAAQHDLRGTADRQAVVDGEARDSGDRRSVPVVGTPGEQG